MLRSAIGEPEDGVRSSPNPSAGRRVKARPGQAERALRLPPLLVLVRSPRADWARPLRGGPSAWLGPPIRIWIACPEIRCSRVSGSPGPVGVTHDMSHHSGWSEPKGEGQGSDWRGRFRLLLGGTWEPRRVLSREYHVT